jgi:hypothetical protein
MNGKSASQGPVTIPQAGIDTLGRDGLLKRDLVGGRRARIDPLHRLQALPRVLAD